MDSERENPFTFIDHETNEQYIIYLTAEDFQKAKRDMIYATELLNSAKSMKVIGDIDKQDADNDNVIVEDCHQAQENCHEGNTDEEKRDDGASDDDNSLLWSKSATLYFLSLYKTYEERVSKGKITQKVVFEKIATQMAVKKYIITAKQCASKMTSLKRMYKKIKDHNGKSGNQRRTWQYFTVVDDIFSTKPWVEPLATASSTPSNTANQESPGAVSLHTESSRKRNVARTLEQYFEKNLNEKREQRAEKLAQHREKMAKLDQMNDFLNNLIQSSKNATE